MRMLAALAALAVLALPAGAQDATGAAALIRQARLIQPAAAKASWQLLPDEVMEEAAEAGPYHSRHAELFGRYAVGYNAAVLGAIDAIQARFPDGGGYFTGPRAEPAESPIGYPLALFGKPLLAPPRSTSFCTGATYAAFIEALNAIFAGSPPALTPERAEAMRMQEPDGGRREDHVKFWGHWNADNTGPEYALVQYSGMGEVIAPERARAGDFMSILWKNGLSHSTVFLGWRRDQKGRPQVLFWASQKKPTDGMGDRLEPLSKIAGVKFVRLTRPQALSTFSVDAAVDTNVPWDRSLPPEPELARGRGHRHPRRR